MATFDSVINEARQLDLADRIRLARQLLDETRTGTQAEEAAAGDRGLAAWTDSTRDEDWSEFYPPDLRQKKAG